MSSEDLTTANITSVIALVCMIMTVLIISCIGGCNVYRKMLKAKNVNNIC